MRLLIIVSAIFFTACSDQYRITDPGATPDQVEEFISGIESIGIASNTFDTALLQDLREDPQNTIYFTRSGTNGLKPETVMSMGDVTPFIETGVNPWRPVNVFELGLQEVSVAFIDGLSSGNQRHFVLMVEALFNNGDRQYYVAISNPGDYVFTDDSFEVRFVHPTRESIILKSFDLDDEFSDLLGNNVKFRVYDGAGIEIGQFSALAGFGS